jgi:hypothetical protein
MVYLGHNWLVHWHTPNLLDRLKSESKVKIVEESRVGGMFPDSQNFWR